MTDKAKSEKTKGYIKPGEVMFVSVRYPHLSLVVDAGGAVQVGDRVVDKKPRFVDFHPGFAGGEFRVNDKTAKAVKMSKEDLLEHLRERDAIDDHYCEVKDSDHLAKLVELREVIVKDEGDLKIEGRVKTQDAASPAPVNPAPAKTEPEAPKPAAGPKKRTAVAA